MIRKVVLTELMNHIPTANDKSLLLQTVGFSKLFCPKLKLCKNENEILKEKNEENTNETSTADDVVLDYEAVQKQLQSANQVNIFNKKIACFFYKQYII